MPWPTISAPAGLVSELSDDNFVCPDKGHRKRVGADRGIARKNHEVGPKRRQPGGLFISENDYIFACEENISPLREFGE